MGDVGGGAHTSILIRVALQITPEILAFIKTGRFILKGPIFKNLKVKVGEGNFPPPFLFPPFKFSPRGYKWPGPPNLPKLKKTTEVPKSYSILIPHRKGEGARGEGGPWIRGEAPPAWWNFPPLNSCPKWDKPGAIAFKNSPHPILSKPKRKKISPSPQT